MAPSGPASVSPRTKRTASHLVTGTLSGTQGAMIWLYLRLLPLPTWPSPCPSSAAAGQGQGQCSSLGAPGPLHMFLCQNTTPHSPGQDRHPIPIALNSGECPDLSNQAEVPLALGGPLHGPHSADPCPLFLSLECVQHSVNRFGGRESEVRSLEGGGPRPCPKCFLLGLPGFPLLHLLFLRVGPGL